MKIIGSGNYVIEYVFKGGKSFGRICVGVS